MPDHARYRRWPIVAAAIATTALVAAAVLTRTGNSSDPAPPGPGRSEAPSAATEPGPGAPSTVEPAENDATDATAFAVRVATASQDWLYQSDEQVAAEVTELATPEAGRSLAEETVAEIRSARDQLGASPGPVWWLVRPMATHVEHTDADTARVAVWVITVLSAQEVAAPQSEWMTITVDLDWTPSGWRVDGVREEPGPTPMTGPRDDPWDAVPFDEGLDGFVRLNGEPVTAGAAP